MNAFVAKWTVRKLSSESCSLTINHINIEQIHWSCFLAQLVEHVSYIFRKKKKKRLHSITLAREGLRLLLTRKSTLNHFCCKFWHFTCSIHPTLPWSWGRPALLAKGLQQLQFSCLSSSFMFLFCTCKIQKYSFYYT